MYSDAVELEIARIKRCDDPKELMTFVNSSYDVTIMRAAANRCYEIMKARKDRKPTGKYVKKVTYYDPLTEIARLECGHTIHLKERVDSVVCQRCKYILEDRIYDKSTEVKK